MASHVIKKNETVGKLRKHGKYVTVDISLFRVVYALDDVVLDINLMAESSVKLE